MKRKLGKFETAAALSGEHAVFNIVGVLELERVPSQAIVRQALDILQNRHPFTRVRLIMDRGRRFFESGGLPAIPLKVIERTDDDHWSKIAEQELNLKFDHQTGPLIQFTFLTNGENRGELILTAQHSIVDGVTVENLFHETLDLCATIHAGEEIDGYGSLPPLPPVEDYFPDEFKGFALTRKSMSYFLHQMGDELKYQLDLRGKRKPPIIPDSYGRIIQMRTPASVTRSIVRRARKERVTLNSTINAALLLSVRKHHYGEAEMPFRYMSMADLRPYLKPPPPRDQMGCYVSPMRYTIRVHTRDELWALAQRINEQVYRSSKQGEKYLASVMGKQFLQMIFGLKRFRMSTTAISYGGPSQLAQSYGPFAIRGMHGFVSNFGLGPEFSGRVGLFDDELWWDMLYMDSDMDHKGAQVIIDEIRAILIRACE